MYIQLDFFPETKEEKRDREIKEIRQSQEKSRKSQFAKIAELKKVCLDLQQRLSYIESAICKNDLCFLQKN